MGIVRIEWDPVRAAAHRGAGAMSESPTPSFIVRCPACGHRQEDRAERCQECGLTRAELSAAEFILARRRAAQVLAATLLLLIPLPFALVLALRLGAFSVAGGPTMLEVLQSWWTWIVILGALPACLVGVILSWLPSTRRRRRRSPPPPPPSTPERR